MSDLEQRWTLRHTHRNVHVIEWEPVAATDGDLVARVLCRSDVHHDHKSQDREMELRHLEQAKACNAPILGNGDQFDVMQSRHDPRREVMGVRAEIAELMSEGTDTEVPPSSIPYVDALVAESANFLRPYRKQLVMFGRGNHDQSAVNHLGTDPVERLVQELRRDGGDVIAGGYSGWVQMRFQVGGTYLGVTLYHYHGHGGGAPVTGGAIDLYRQAAHVDADIVWIGHKHQEQERTLPTWYLTRNNLTPSKRERLAMMTPGYVMDPGDGYDGHMTKTAGNQPRPVGQAWLEFRWARKTKRLQVERRLAK